MYHGKSLSHTPWNGGDACSARVKGYKMQPGTILGSGHGSGGVVTGAISSKLVNLCDRGFILPAPACV